MVSFFENYLETLKQQEKDAEYFKDAVSIIGRRFSEELCIKPNVLGKGGFGFVRDCIRKKKGEDEENPIVTKVIYKSNLFPWQISEDGTLIEADILARLSHKSIIKVIGLYENISYYHLILTKCPGITLFELIELNKRLEEGISRHLFRSLILLTISTV